MRGALALDDQNLLLDGSYDPFSAQEHIEEEVEMIEEDHEDYIVQITVHPFQQTAQGTEQHKERMKTLDTIRVTTDIPIDVRDLLSADEFGVEDIGEDSEVVQDEQDDLRLASLASLDVFMHQQGI